MAKTKPLFPKEDNKNTSYMPSLGELLHLLRLVADGDEDARQALKELLDIFDQVGLTDEILNLTNQEDGEEEATDMLFDTRAMNLRELHIRIKLNNIDIKIWRELKVPSNMRLDSFANVLLDAMGWMHEHMYQFRDGQCDYCMKEALEDALGFRQMEDMSKYNVGDIFIEKGKRLKFEYDFGDGWEHDVWLKGERAYEKDETPVVSCFKGQGACPPEDCGGVWGYKELIELAQKKKLSKEERERLDWYGIERGYDPNDYDPDYYEFEDEVAL